MTSVGDMVRYVTATWKTERGVTPGLEKVGKVLEAFPSQTGEYMCYWIEGEKELILEGQILEVLQHGD